MSEVYIVGVRDYDVNDVKYVCKNLETAIALFHKERLDLIVLLDGYNALDIAAGDKLFWCDQIQMLTYWENPFLFNPNCECPYIKKMELIE